jgi:hypothetical protein
MDIIVACCEVEYQHLSEEPGEYNERFQGTSSFTVHATIRQHYKVVCEAQHDSYEHYDAAHCRCLFDIQNITMPSNVVVSTFGTSRCRPMSMSFRHSEHHDVLQFWAQSDNLTNITLKDNKLK